MFAVRKSVRILGLMLVTTILVGCGAVSPAATGVMNAATPAAQSTTATNSASSTEWLSVDLVNAHTGQTYKLTDFKGKVLLVEAMAVWCTNCFQQQTQVKALRQAMGQRSDLVTVDLDVDPNENTAMLKAYIEKNNFDWTYAVAPALVDRALGNLYTAQFLNPTSTPMLIVDKQGLVHPLPFGIKSAQVLQSALEPYLK
jgi:cytochrome oxidase Cu insertion factor (SCO1/SenC/PrrC family)